MSILIARFIVIGIGGILFFQFFKNFLRGFSVEFLPWIAIYEVGYIQDLTLRVAGQFSMPDEAAEEGVVFLVFCSLVACVGIGVEGAFL